MADTSFINSPAFAALINGALAVWQSKQNSKTPNTYQVPQTPEEKWVTDAKKDLYGNASGFVNSYLGGLGNLQPDYKMNTNEVGNPAFMGGIKVPSFNFKPKTPAAPIDTSKGGGGADNPRGDIPRPGTGGADIGGDSVTPGGGKDPFGAGWEGPAGVGGPDSPDAQRLIAAAKQYGPGILAQFFGGPLASLAMAIYKMFTGKAPTTPTPDLGTQDSATTLTSGPGNWNPKTSPDLGMDKNQGTLGEIFNSPTDATGAQQTWDFWNNLMNAPGQIGPDYFSMRVNPNVGRKH